MIGLNLHGRGQDPPVLLLFEINNAADGFERAEEEEIES